MAMAVHPCNCLWRSRPKVIFILVFGIIFIASTYNLITYDGRQSRQTGYFNESSNTFNRISEKSQSVATSEQKYVVDTPACKIPEMDPMDSSIQKFLKPDFGYPVDCKGKLRPWTHVNGTKLSLNTSAIHESGYSLGSVHCCYRIIIRVEQPVSHYDINADNYIKYSKECYPVEFNGTEVDAEFIRVHCISKSIPLLHDVVYRDFFAIAQPSSDRLASSKLSKWSKKGLNKITTDPNYRPPPNVVIIGIDNNSRMNTHRHLLKTVAALQRLGAVELLGYTKVAENTFVNTVPFLAGLSVKDMSSQCYKSDTDPQDDCPYIWKLFDSLGYITVHAEDTPYLGGFNYLKTGFLRKPTDYYLRTLMLAVMTFMPRFDYYHTDCIGRYMTDEFVFKYVLDLVQMTKERHAPVFIHSWLTSLAHHSYNNIQFGDASIVNFIHSLVNVSNDNSIFFFMSDHGQRYGPIRETSQGWYEDKLPTQWVYLPKYLREKYPEWQSSLQINSRKLTSHFDVYKTLLQILKEVDGDHQLAEFYSDKAVSSLKGQSLFEIVPENRTCEDAGVTVNFCACSKPEPIDALDERVQDAAKAAVQHLKSVLPLDVCAEPVLKQIVSAGYLNFPSRPVYVISLVTDPGDFLFEVNVEVEHLEGEQAKFVINTEFLRMNKISRAANCVSSPLLERYCYCK